MVKLRCDLKCEGPIFKDRVFGTSAKKRICIDVTIYQQRRNFNIPPFKLAIPTSSFREVSCVLSIFQETIFFGGEGSNSYVYH